MNPLEITLLILLVTIIAFVSGKVPFSVISTGIILIANRPLACTRIQVRGRFLLHLNFV